VTAVVPSPPDYPDAPPVPISALQHALHCERQCALIHVERAWAENQLTAEGRVLHATADRQDARSRRGLRIATALPIASRRLGITGVADAVEFRSGPDGETAYPVEYKRGRPKRHRADEVQLCAQGLCLEEMTGRPVPEGALFYGETRRRMVVAFDAELRAITKATAARVAVILATPSLPAAIFEPGKCRACSLAEVCRPQLAGRSACAFVDRSIAAALADGPAGA